MFTVNSKTLTLLKHVYNTVYHTVLILIARRDYYDLCKTEKNQNKTKLYFKFYLIEAILFTYPI